MVRVAATGEAAVITVFVRQVIVHRTIIALI